MSISLYFASMFPPRGHGSRFVRSLRGELRKQQARPEFLSLLASSDREQSRASGVFDKFLNMFADSARHLDHAVLLRGSPSWGDDVLASLSCWNRTGPIWRAWFGMDAPNSELSDVPAFCWL